MARMKSEMMMCPSTGPKGIVMKIIAAALAAAGLWTIVGGVLGQMHMAAASSVFLWYFAGFILLMLAAFYYFEKGTLIVSVTLAVLAGFTRPEGFLLSIPFLARGFAPPRWSLSLSPTSRAKHGFCGVVTALTLPVFLYFHPSAITVEDAWGKVPIFSASGYLTFYFWVAVVVTLISLGLILYPLRNRDLLPRGTFTYTLLAIVQVLVFIFAVDYHALPRVNMLLLTPLWIAPRIKHSILLVTLNLALMVLVTILFVNSYFFF